MLVFGNGALVGGGGGEGASMELSLKFIFCFFFKVPTTILLS